MSFRSMCMAVMIGVAFPVVGYGQSAGYLDADSLGEAAGMMYSTKMGNRIFKARCIEKFPDMAQQIEADLVAWQNTEADAIRKADAYYELYRSQNPKASAEMASVLEMAFKKNIDGMAELPGEAGTALFRQVCEKHFSALASGAWRERTPNAYKYLDEAP